MGKNYNFSYKFEKMVVKMFIINLYTFKINFYIKIMKIIINFYKILNF